MDIFRIFWGFYGDVYAFMAEDDTGEVLGFDIGFNDVRDGCLPESQLTR